MSENSDTDFETRLRAAASEFVYPPTPDIAARVTERLVSRPSAPRRRWAWVGLTVVLLIAALALAHPTARAAVAELLQVGAIRILLGDPMPTALATDEPAAAGDDLRQATLTPGAQPARATLSGSQAGRSTDFPTDSLAAPPSATGVPTATPLPSILALAEAAELDQAESRAGLEVRLPGYPPDLGPPSRVYLLELETPMVILIWDQPQGVRLTLQIIKEQIGVFTLTKGQPPVIAQTDVDGHTAYWTHGPYYLEIEAEPRTFRLLVEGNVLIWSDGELTYRLESGLAMDQAIRIAESLE